MDIEQLKIVMETIKQVAGTAGDVGMWWVVLHYISALLGKLIYPICWVVVVYIAARAVVNFQQKGKTIDITGELQGMAITSDCSHELLFVQLRRLCGKGTVINSKYIHKQSVKWLEEAIDAKEELERKEK